MSEQQRWKFFELISPNMNVDFVKWSRPFVVISFFAVIASVYLMFRPGFNFGVDFTGGTVVQLKFASPTTAEEVRALIHQVGDAGATVVAMGEDHREYMITSRTPVEGGEKNKLADAVVSKLGKDQVEIQKIDVVGPKVGEELKWSAIKALVYSIIFIMIYIWFRFDFKFAPGATVAMVHDLIVISGIYVLSGREFTIASVAALLTIAGYSVNDTIVIYDRARENVKIGGGAGGLAGIINKAMNQTFSRTIITALLTFLSILGLLFYTDGEIEDFAFTMAMGIALGAYSTLFIAAPFTLFMEKLGGKAAAK